ncbi:MAG: hypothetical protein PHW82_05445 [Bacteroidales bacterium]|nr:hypothetical protein [Bacteroidales bacterium]
MKPEKNDIKISLKFDFDELDLLQDNAWNMSESFCLDSRICNMTGKRAIGLYSWDLDCLHDVIYSLKNKEEDQVLVDRLLIKLKTAMDEIYTQRNSR